VTCCVLTVFVLTLGVLVTGPTLMGSFKGVESAATAQKAMQVYRAFEADLRQLALTNRDYAQWDDSVQFVQDHNQHYIDANLVPNTLNGIHVDLVWIVDRDGKEIYSGLTDRSAAVMVSPAPRDYLREVARFLPKGSTMGFIPVNAVVATAHGLVAVTAQQIRRTDQSQATGATLLFGRFIKDSDIQRVRETSQLR
jgi:sensor domain CHASE-containing protein